MTRFTKTIVLLVVLLTATIVCASQGHDEAGLAFEMSTVLVLIFGIIPTKQDDKSIKGIIQFDKEHYDVPAMRFAFYENPLNLINCDEVTFKVDRNSTIEEETKYIDID